MNPAINPQDTLLSRLELAKRWSVSTKTIQRHEKAGKLKPISLSSHVVRYRLSDIIAIEEDATARN